MKATSPNGSPVLINNCYINIPDFGLKIIMWVLPDISDSKSASYPDEKGTGRSTPFKSFEGSDTRTISWSAHFIATESSDIEEIINDLRMLEACVYPRSQNTGGAPYAPPPICQLRCGELLSSSSGPDVCCVLKNYSVKFDTSVPWDETTLLPYKLDVDLQFDVAYNQSALPGAEQIMTSGY